MTAPKLNETQTPSSDVPPADWCDHPEGFEDGFFEDWDDGDDNGGYPTTKAGDCGVARRLGAEPPCRCGQRS